jgi:hypothetical protein
MKKVNNNRDCLWHLEKEWRKETIIVIDGGGSGGYTRASKNEVGEKNSDFRWKQFVGPRFLSSPDLVKQIWIWLAWQVGLLWEVGMA